MAMRRKTGRLHVGDLGPEIEFGRLRIHCLSLVAPDSDPVTKIMRDTMAEYPTQPSYC